MTNKEELSPSLNKSMLNNGHLMGLNKLEQNVQRIRGFINGNLGMSPKDTLFVLKELQAHYEMQEINRLNKKEEIINGHKTRD